MPRINLNNVEMGKNTSTKSLRVIAAIESLEGSVVAMDGWRGGYSIAADARQSVNDDNEYFKKHNIKVFHRMMPV